MATKKASSYAVVASEEARLEPRLESGSQQGLRADGRGHQECRSPFMQVGAVSSAAGSAYVEFGQTKAIVSVFGPRESKKAQAYSDIGRLNCHVSFATFATSVRGKAGQGLEEKEYSSMLLKALESAVALHTFPKTTVDVFALILQSGGGDLPVVMSCASLALADAGIAMYDLVSAVSLSCLGSKLMLDPTLEEESRQDGGLMVAYMTSRKEITQLTLTGEWPSTRLAEGLEITLDACKKLAEIMRECLRESATD